MTKEKVYIVGHDQSMTRMFLDGGFPTVSNPKIAEVIVFIGGADINPTLYGQKAHPSAGVQVSHVDDQRDISQWEDSKGTDQLRIGICRGGQFLHAMNGGKLYQHVSGHASGHIVHDALWGTSLSVTSSHHQMMMPGAGEILAYAEKRGSHFKTDEGPVETPPIEPEVVWHENGNSLCVQFHPEWTPEKSLERAYFFDLIEVVTGRKTVENRKSG